MFLSPNLKTTLLISVFSSIKCIMLDFVLFTLIHHFLDQLERTSNMLCISSSDGAINAMSSAYKSKLTFFPLTLIPAFKDLISSAKSFRYIENKEGDRLSPCLAPNRVSNDETWSGARLQLPLEHSVHSSFKFYLWINICPICLSLSPLTIILSLALSATTDSLISYIFWQCVWYGPESSGVDLLMLLVST